MGKGWIGAGDIGVEVWDGGLRTWCVQRGGMGAGKLFLCGKVVCGLEGLCVERWYGGRRACCVWRGGMGAEGLLCVERWYGGRRACYVWREGMGGWDWKAWCVRRGM